MVLLENENNTLPLQTTSIALFGGGAVRTIKGGYGSGDPYNGGLSGGGAWDVELNERYNIHIYNSFKKAGYNIVNSEMLDEYAAAYDAEHEIQGNSTMSCFTFPELEITDSQLKDAAAATDTAIYVISRNAGEGTDRTLDGTQGTYQEEAYDIGDYNLTALERENLERVAAAFDKTIVVLNVGGIVDTKFYDEIEGLDAMLLMGQAGQEGGNALMDVLSGAVTPSGKLADTWAVDYSDYPASDTFANADGDISKEVYSEGIYVGYRYFDTFNVTPAYEFGYGLSYTDFSVETQSVEATADTVTVTAKVTNTGDTYSGKEVVQVYFSAPDSEQAEKEYQELAAFGKTDELAPGESQILTLSFDTADMAYYNEEQAAYILDAGTYYIRVGDSSRNTSVAAAIELDQAVITEQLSNQLTVPDEEDLIEWTKPDTSYSYRTEAQEKAAAPVIQIAAADVATENHTSVYENEEVTTYTTDPNYEATQSYEKVEVVEEKNSTLKDVIDGKVTMGEFIAQMSLEELAALNCGSGWGVANENSPIVGSNSATVKGAAGETTLYEEYGIPSIVLADGPGGVRVAQEFDATVESTGETQTYYQYCTAWPVSYVQAQTWDVDLVEQIGEAFGEEVDEMNITLLLGPSQNIHRDPLCGRNFEYYSEDPVMAGVMAAACTKGVQATPGVGACLKHFAANNQESNRSAVDTIVSERTLREIYLKGFEIAVKEARPMSIMTSYNLINGVPTADSYDLCTNIARGEWGFDGLIMTDWNGGSSTPMISMHAGNDLIMPGGSSKAENIVNGMCDNAPVFDERGQVDVQVDTLYGFIPYYSSTWNEFQVSADGTTEVTATLGDGYTATVDADGKILVNGEEIYLSYSTGWFSPGKFSNPVTTEVASVGNDGKTITYKGSYEDNNIICLGDVQKSAINNLNIIMNSNIMARQYDVDVEDYSTALGELASYQTVTKSEVIPSIGYSTVTEGFDWGPAITKVILHVGQEMSGTLDTENFNVSVTRKAISGWLLGPSSGTRNVTAAYVSDAEGNKVETGTCITLEMEVHPDLGISSPFNYNFFGSGHNEYVETDYSVSLNQALTSVDGSSINFTANQFESDATLICDDFDLSGSYTYADEEFGDITLTYGAYTPESATKDNKQNALIIWLHGAGEGGTDPRVALIGNKVVNLATDTVQKYFDGGAYVLAPQCGTMWMDDGTGSYTSDGTSMYTRALMALIKNFVRSNPDIDSNRVYIGGCSNGGFMTMKMITSYPDYFAAAYPTCEALTDSALTDEMVESIKNMPIWFTHAKTDTTVRIGTIDEDGTFTANGNYSPKAYERLVAAGGSDIHFSLFDRVVDTTGLYKKADGTPYEYNGHWSWLYVLNDECVDTIDGQEVTIWQWMSQKSKENRDLGRVIALLDSLDASDYTAASWAPVEEALAAAKAVAADQTATQSDVDAVLADLLAAFGGLEYGIQTLHLETAIEIAEDFVSYANKYTGTDALAEVVESGKVVLADASSTQEDVDAATYAILDALAALSEEADAGALERLLDAAKGLLNGNYTSDSLDVLRKAIEAAEAVLNNPDSTEADFSEAYNNILDAIIHLELQANKAALKAMIAKAEAVLENEGTYVAGTVEGLAEELAAAREVYEDDNASQSTVNEAVTSLTLKLANARLIGDVDGDGVVATSDSVSLLQYASESRELSADEAAAADVNGDGVVDTSDAVRILQFAAEKIAAF
jgi:beta-glucosidase